MKRVMLLVPLAALALVAAGCGGSGNPSGVASVATTTTAATSTTASGAGALVAFSQCMRANGVPNFPDPQSYAHGNVKLTVLNLGTGPTAQAAMNACHHLLPSGGPGDQETAQQLHTRLADELSFATCMRRHGVARFPDPTAHGDLSVQMVQAQGIDVRSPEVLHVVQTCLPASHGALTAAKVREAIQNAGG